MSALLSTFGVDWKLLLAQGVNFLILLFALTWLLYKPVMKMVKERERVVAKGVDDAEAAAMKLREADAEANKLVGAADKKAEGIVKSARAEAGEVGAKLVKDAEARAAQVAADAEARAEEAQAKAKRESEKDIARLAVLAAEKVMREGHAKQA